jgi:hypothetical protein
MKIVVVTALQKVTVNTGRANFFRVGILAS